jgi:hypothetical protein
MKQSRRQFVSNLGSLFLGSTLSSCKPTVTESPSSPRREITLYHILNYHGQPDTLENYAFLNAYQKQVYEVILDLKKRGATDFYSEGISETTNPTQILPGHYTILPLLEEKILALSTKDSNRFAQADEKLREQCAVLDKQFPYLRGAMTKLCSEGKIGITVTEIGSHSLSPNNLGAIPEDEFGISIFEKRENAYLSQIAATATGDKVVFLLGASHNLGSDKSSLYRTLSLPPIERVSHSDNVMMWNNAQVTSQNPVYFKLIEIDPLRYIFRR